MAELLFKASHIEIVTDIGAIRFEWLKTENSNKKKVKFSAGPKSATFEKVLLPDGGVEITKSGENLEDEDIIEFANDWIDRARGHVDLLWGLPSILRLIDYDEITSHFEALENAIENSDADDI